MRKFLATLAVAALAAAFGVAASAPAGAQALSCNYTVSTLALPTGGNNLDCIAWEGDAPAEPPLPSPRPALDWGPFASLSR
jgi:hypothetical protein